MRSGLGERHIVNPSKLEPARRDSVCFQCHLTGAARVARPGRGPATFQPGDLLSEHVTVFVWTDAAGERSATDHAEQFSRSLCRIRAGDKLWCGTCHDPHSQPAPAQRVSFYRRSCVMCHGEDGCTGPGGEDCSSCHMPKGRSKEGEHVVYTDHTISRGPRTASQPRRLRAFWELPPSDRDLGLATASLPLLERAARAGSADAVLLAQLAQAYDNAGRAEEAVTTYERLLKADPLHPGLANLAVHRMRAGRVSEAVALWDGVFSRNPALSAPGLNLAIAQLSRGDTTAAQATLFRVLRFHPDLAAARQMLAKLR
jgi:predicted CXXCH cytochrome family protein